MAEKQKIIGLHDHSRDLSSLLPSLPRQAEADRAAEVFSRLCDGTRLRILYLLCHCEECVTDIALSVDMSAPAVSHHLRVLKSAGLLVSRRQGKETLYRLADTQEAALVHEMVDRVFRMTCPNKP